MNASATANRLALRPLLTASLLVARLALPAAAVGQHTDAEDVEIIRPPAKAAPPGKSPDLARVAKLITLKTNEFRRQEKRPEVEVNARLARTAESFAHYMAKTNRFGHTADGSRPADRARKNGYEFCIIAENIAYQYSSQGFTAEELAEAIFRGWKESPGHRKNMLDPDVTDVGVAVARAEDTGYYYAVQDFGRPASKRIEFEIASESDDTARYTLGGQEFSLSPRHIRTHQICRPAELAIPSAEGNGGPAAVRPGEGDRYIITKEGRRFRLTKG
jgi:uncharacterized protein YkwD